MPTEHQIFCINKSNRSSAHERISHISGRNHGGEHWKLTLDKAIASIESGKWSFFVIEAGRKARVIVATSANGRKYLKTESDGEQPNNLLSLPECP